ncbi:acetone carboxylase subunit gamma [Zhongshania aliphaticivorans]|uniref:acetone carboxylase subunit gamma n=1 Tax=Zhongshania aliphaticivorans TaxID=1470434 RepID=UPI0012E68B6E|nr:acetone carboxylase subunit gamma [Zhongshania aliphaticivorans]CAA0093308.1 Acetophenone carboxylase beta subunit [Zhongshania aliphaticivorans]
MKVLATEYLRVDLEEEMWECDRCDHVLGPARENYKRFLLIHDRNPREVHHPLLDPERYRFCFSPDPEVCVIYEFYCPHCGLMMDVEYTVPGHAPLHDLELDIDSLKEKWCGATGVENDSTANTAAFRS